MTSGKGTGNKEYIKQLEWAGAPPQVIESYLKRQDFLLFDVNMDAWEIVTGTGPADMVYVDHQKGNRMYRRFSGFKTPALQAVIEMFGVKPKKRKALLKKIRLIEYGAIDGGNI